MFKDFRRCYKHLNEWLEEEFSGEDATERAGSALRTARRLAAQLEQEAASAKGEDQELYQRKSKILPKYQSMVKTLQDHYTKLGGSITSMESADAVPLHPTDDTLVPNAEVEVDDTGYSASVLKSENQETSSVS